MQAGRKESAPRFVFSSGDGCKFPFGRIGEPNDAAKLIRFLASDEAEWITSQVIHSEGGFLRADSLHEVSAKKEIIFVVSLKNYEIKS